MAEVIIRVRPNGPFIVEGPVQLLDGQGNPFPIKPDKPIALCRCGHSRQKPFCDGAHRSCGFVAEEAAATP